MKILKLLFSLALVLHVSCTGGSAFTNENISNITVDEAYRLISEKAGRADFVILDIRTPGEYLSGHIEGAVNIDYSSPAFKDDLKKLDRSLEYLVYCRSGNRSARAMPVFSELGFKKVYNMTGGTVEWFSSGKKLVK